MLPTVRTILNDLRFAVRMLRRNPGFTAVAVITLALGVGANTAIFSLLNASLLRALPYRDPERLVWVTEYAPRLNSSMTLAGVFLSWRERNRSFEEMAGYVDHVCDGNLVIGKEAVRLDHCAEVTANLFHVLGVQPALGRVFTLQETYPGAPAVTILSDGFWRGKLGSDPTVLGKTIRVDNVEYTIVGILPATFEHPGELKPDVFMPLILPATIDWHERETDKMSVIARLKSCVSSEQANTELRAITAPLQENYSQEVSEKIGGAEVRLLTLREHLFANTHTTLFVLVAAAGLVLLMACANIANLLLARTTARHKEFAMRVMLGAGPMRIIGQVLTEGILLSFLGSTAGLLVAIGTIDLLSVLWPTFFSHFGTVRLSGAALIFTLLISFITAILFSLAPAVLAFRANLSNSMNEAGGRATPGGARQTLGNALVMLELALAFLLLIGAGLLIRTLENLHAVKMGFDPKDVLTLQVTLAEAKYPQPTQQAAFFDKLFTAIRALPGVESVGGTTSLPLYYGFSHMVNVTIEDQTSFSNDHSSSAPLSVVTPEYFSAMQIPVAAGRSFTLADRKETLPVAIVSREFTRRFAMRDPLGKHLRFGLSPDGPEQEFTIVGVVDDVRYLGPGRELAPVVFISTTQFPTSALTLAVRTKNNPAGLTNEIRIAVQNLEQDEPIYHVATMEQRLNDSMTAQRLNALLLGFFAGIAILLAAVGIYGVISYWVNQRTHEIGVRIALGAQRWQVLQLVVGRALRLTIIGLAAGIFGAVSLSHSLASLLFGLKATDALTFTGVAIALAGVAFIATILPALRAMRIDPILALRYE